MTATKAAAKRRIVVTALAVVTTLAALVAGAATTMPALQVTALGVAMGAGTVSLVLAQKRGGLLGWYAITAAVLVYRLTMHLLGSSA